MNETASAGSLTALSGLSALVGKRLSGAEEVSDDGLTLDQLEVLLRRGHRVGPGRGLPKPFLDSPLGIIPVEKLYILRFSLL